MELDPTLKSVLETLEDIGAKLDKMNEVPTTAVAEGVEDQTSAAPRRIMNAADRSEIAAKLRTKSTPELLQMFSVQAREKGTGVPFDLWANTGGYSVQAALGQDPMLTKALDTGGATALIRQDLEPVLYELYIREFPAWQRIAKEPANGLTHAYNQITAYGDAQFMTELGTVTDDVSTYVRKTTNVSVIATRRGISLKSQFAVQAGGMSYNPEALELQGGMRAIAHKMQKTIFQGNSTVTGGTATTEDGLYDANAFDGLRTQLKSNTTIQGVDPTAATPEDMRAAIDRAAQGIMDLGGRVNLIYCRPTDKVTFDLQQDKNVRYMNSFVDVTPGVQTNAVNTVFGPLPLAVIPGDSIGTYTYNATTVGDMYLLDEGTIAMPYLGSEGPTVLDIPIGISGQLTHLYIMFGMWGLAVKALPFSTKVRVKQAA